MLRTQHFTKAQASTWHVAGSLFIKCCYLLKAPALVADWLGDLEHMT